jgi:NAD(P)-dependent dehydrogenase (short-subunit alcohol dehydrogenase family)
MKHVVITGSSRGIGYGLAQAFLARGCAVTISGRSVPALDSARQALGASAQVLGAPCDVRDPAQVQALWQAARERFGQVDIWINNAGISGPQLSIWELPAEQAAAVIQTNILGMIYGCQTAVQGMLAQGFGAIYNMEGMGSNGRKHRGLTAYGTSKYAVRYFTGSLALELTGAPLLVGALSPGMIVTDMIRDQYKGRLQAWEQDRRVFNLLAERLEVVAPWLAERVLANTRSGARIAWLTPARMLSQAARGFLGLRQVVA